MNPFNQTIQPTLVPRAADGWRYVGKASVMGYLVAILAIVVVLAASVAWRMRSSRDPNRPAEEAAHGNSIPDSATADVSTENSEELSKEEDNRQAQHVQRIHVLCQLAESHLDDFEDEYECNKLSERLQKAVDMAEEINDPFYYGAAIHPVISLAHRAGWSDIADGLLETVSDSYVKEKIVQEVFQEHT